MKSNYVIVNKSEIDDTEWDNLVFSSTDGWLYQTNYWINLIDKCEIRSSSFGVRSSKGQLLAVFPLYRGDYKALKFMTIKRLYTGLSGPVISNTINQKQRNKLLKYMFKYIDDIAEFEKIDILQVRLTMLAPTYFSSESPTINPLFYVGLVSPISSQIEKAVQPLTRMIFLDKPEDQLLMEMETDCRAAVRQAERSGLDFVEGNSDDALSTYVHLHDDSWRRTGLAPHTMSYFENMWSSLSQINAIKIFFAKHEGRVVAAIMVHVFKEGVFYWGGCSEGDSLKLRPNNFLLWNTICWAKNNGFRSFEIGQFYPSPTDNQKEYNVGKYKVQFGRDELVPFEGQKVYRSRKIIIVELLNELKILLRRCLGKNKDSYL